MAEIYNEQRVLGVKVLSDGGSGGASNVTVDNFPASQAVTGPITNAQFTAVTGAAAAAAYTDVTGVAAGTEISLLKGIFVQLAAINAKTPVLP